MNQNQLLLKHLKKRPITPLEALSKLGIFRLSARILELKQAGYTILTTIIKKGGKHFAQYRLIK